MRQLYSRGTGVCGVGHVYRGISSALRCVAFASRAKRNELIRLAVEEAHGTELLHKCVIVPLVAYAKTVKV